MYISDHLHIPQRMVHRFGRGQDNAPAGECEQVPGVGSQDCVPGGTE